MSGQHILDFWANIGPQGWWVKNPQLDAAIKDRFGDAYQQAACGELDHWANNANGALALIILLDQFSRNLFRNSPLAFARDKKALALASAAIERGDDLEVAPDLRIFFYLPFEHSESIVDQLQSLRLMHSAGNQRENMKAARIHHEIIHRFGRFPHRNSVLGRHTTPAEAAYLSGGGFKG